jgi:hypothetical protein
MYVHEEENQIAKSFARINARRSRLQGLISARNLVVNETVEVDGNPSDWLDVIECLIAAEMVHPRPIGIERRAVEATQIETGKEAA